jgi:hypothetical protein
MTFTLDAMVFVPGLPCICSNVSSMPQVCLAVAPQQAQRVQQQQCQYG